MKKFKSIIAALALVALAGTAAFIVGCSHTNSAVRDGAQAHQYSCSMHHEVVQDHRGNCPKCGMKLIHND